MKKETRGGAGRNQGLRPGTYKNAQKPPEFKHSIKKQVSYTPEQWQRVEAKMKEYGIKKFSDYARMLTLS